MVIGYEWQITPGDGLRQLEMELSFLGGMCAASLMKKDLVLPVSTGQFFKKNHILLLNSVFFLIIKLYFKTNQFYNIGFLIFIIAVICNFYNFYFCNLGFVVLYLCCQYSIILFTIIFCYLYYFTGCDCRFYST